MKLENARQNYYFHTGKTSDLVRQIGLGGIAIIWLFRKEVAGVPKIPEELHLPLVLIALALALDFLHYALASVIWGVYQRKMEMQVDEEYEFEAPPQLNWPAIGLFAAKSTAVVAAYVLLIRFLAGALVP